MLQPRIIPCLLVRGKGLVKTVQFKEPKYVGDPINAVKIFNEKRVDELVLLDIDATKEGREPDLRMIENVAAECRMPLCYGGGIRSVVQATRIFSLGVEKVALSSAAISNPLLVRQIADSVGNQSVVVVLDVKKKRFGRGYEAWTHNATKSTGHDPVELVETFQQHGVGEIVINSIDRDGTMTGYDLVLVELMSRHISVPYTVLGGAGSLEHLRALFARFGVLGAAAGSLFVFKGAYRAVLISYPDMVERDAIAQLAHRAQLGASSGGQYT
jgi:imidazole glycerol-phosphate synthase subunit HisF